MSIEEQISAYVEERLSAYSPKTYRESKVIHDSLWGTNRYYPHELILIDCPLFQRLRYITQTGLAFLVYPTLNHSRFEHSLGMVTIVTRIIHGLKEKLSHPSQVGGALEETPTGKHFAELRMAALLHDLGHGFLSHVSEGIYKWYPEFNELRRRKNFSQAKASEIITYMILVSDPFRKLFAERIAPLVPGADLDTIAELIIGRASPEHFYLAQIVNGALDADKVDYISRDTFYSGVSTTMDVDRLLNDLHIHNYPTTKLNTLVLTSPIPLERILFSKILLYTTIYHHQKVKAADCMVEGLLEYVRETDNTLYGLNFSNPIDFLKVTDNDFFSGGAASRTDRYVQDTINNLINRNLLQRCLVLSRETIDDYESNTYYLNRLSQSPALLRELRQQIVNELGSTASCTVYDVWVSLPEQPSLREASQTLALLPGHAEPVKLSAIFPLDGWLRAFSNNKWRGHVFAPQHAQAAVYKAAKKVLEEGYGIRLNVKSSAYAHVTDDSM